MNRAWIFSSVLLAVASMGFADSPTTAPATAPATDSATAPASAPATAPATGPAPATQAATQPAPGTVELSTQKQRLSYLLGMKVATDIRRQGLDLDPAILTAAINDAYAGRPPQLTRQQVAETIDAIQKEVAAKRAAGAFQSTAIATKNLRDGIAFLEANAKKDGVIVLPSGLQYKIIKTGKGKQPTLSDTVLANYTGSLIDGTVFDSSEKNGGPVEFPVKGVIPGWTEALQKMHEGDRWQVFIPASLAYGENGPGPIGPNSTLIFDMELVSVK